MHVDDFSYELPEELIAQRAPDERDGGRLMLLGREGGAVANHLIGELPSLLPAGCLVVVNDTRVLPARLTCRRKTGGVVELLLLEELAERGRWRCMARAAKHLREDEVLAIEGAAEVATATLLTPVREGRAEVALSDPDVVRRAGSMPIPPYIRRDADALDLERYQTVFADREGSVAAPTAGLHFSASLLDRLRAADIEICAITLHVGPGTFQPVRCTDPSDHAIEPERYSVSADAAASIARAKRTGRRVVAVGTTVVRTLETTGGREGSGRTGLVVLPGHRFAVVDALLTNFHLPRSTLLMLVAAFAGREAVLAAYREAVRQRYRFYSYGDAMLIV